MPLRDYLKCFTCDQLWYKLPLALSLGIYMLNSAYLCDPYGDLEWDVQLNRTKRGKTGSAADCMKLCKIYSLRLELLKNEREMDTTLELFEDVIQSTPPNAFCYPPQFELDRSNKFFEYNRFQAIRSRSEKSYRVLITTILLSFIALMCQVGLMVSAGVNQVVSFYILAFFAAFSNILSFSYGVTALAFTNCDHGESIYTPDGKFIEFKPAFFCDSEISVWVDGGKTKKVRLPDSHMRLFRIGQTLKILNFFLILMGTVYFYRKTRYLEMRAARANLPVIPTEF